MTQSQLSSERQNVAQALGKWSQILDDPNITLFGVFKLIDRALDQSWPYSCFPVARFLSDLPEPLSSWFRLWDEESEEMREPFSYWQANLEEDQMNVEFLIEEMGGGFLFADL